MMVYGYVLLKGASLISEGSEHLLGVLSPGIVGGKQQPSTARPEASRFCRTCPLLAALCQQV